MTRVSLQRLCLLALLACVLVPWSQAAAAPDTGADSTCVSCHEQEEDEEMVVPVVEWRESVHAEHGVSCDACHGGDPHEEDADLSMSEEAGFLDNPSWREMADYCGACHEAIGESWTLGDLGRRASQGTRVASCDTCHMSDGHRIVESLPEDLLIGERCARCEPLQEAEGLVAQVSRIAALEARATKGAQEVEVMGINAMPLFRDVDAVHDSFTTTLHRFERGLIEPEGFAARVALEAIELRALDDQREAISRREYGTAVLVALSLVLVSLFWIRRRLP